MKRAGLFFLILWMSANLVTGQNAKVQTAFNYYKEPYQQYDKAKEAIDEAAVNESTSGKSKTWYYRGLIYAALFKSEKYGTLCDNCLITAFESYQKAMELDPKNEWADEITAIRIPTIANQIFDMGAQQYKNKDYKGALANFESALKVLPGDTVIIANCAFAAKLGKDNAKAEKYFTTLIGMKYNDDRIYEDLSEIYMEQNDSAKALKTIRDGRVIFPDSMSLLTSEINILLKEDKSIEVAQLLEAAIQKDPNNPSLYLALGSSFDKLANPPSKDGKNPPVPKDYTVYFAKAEDAYKKGLAINPDNSEFNYALGALYFNDAAQQVRQANELKVPAEYDKAKVKFDKRFREAQPFLEKSLEKNPKKTNSDLDNYEGTLITLKQIYVRFNEMEKYNKIKDLSEKK